MFQFWRAEAACVSSSRRRLGRCGDGQPRGAALAPREHDLDLDLDLDLDVDLDLELDVDLDLDLDVDVDLDVDLVSIDLDVADAARREVSFQF